MGRLWVIAKYRSFWYSKSYEAHIGTAREPQSCRIKDAHPFF